MGRFLAAFRPLMADFLSTIFFVAFYAITGSIRAAIVLGIAVGIGQIGFMLLTRKSIAAMQWVSLVLVVTMGGASLITHNARFIMIKPSIGFLAVGLVMLKRGWMNRYLPAIVTENVEPAVPVHWGHVWAAMMLVFAISNLVVAFLAGPEAWAWFISVVPTVSQFLLFAVQYASLRMIVGRNIRARAVREGGSGAAA